MGMAKKLEMSPDEAFLQAAMRAGTCTIQEVSMKALGEPDVAYQARVVHLDMGHVHRLSQVHDVQGSIGPVVIFRAGGRMILADGFHRHEMARRKKLLALRAYVVDVEEGQVEHEARLYASMCNQQLSLTRTRDDVRKAVRMLLEDEECWGWTDRRIAHHCGVSPTTVTRGRLEMSEEWGRPVPVVGETKAGRLQARHPVPREIHRQTTKGCVYYSGRVGGQKLHLGTDAGAAPGLLAEAVARRGKTLESLDWNRLLPWLTARGILFKATIPNPTMYRPLRGYHGQGFVFTTARFDGEDTVPSAVGRVLGLRALCGDPAARLVVVCFPTDGPAVLIDLYRGIGFEFLTPDELVASLAGPGEP